MMGNPIAYTLKQYWPTLLCVAVILYATLSADPTAGAELPLIPHLDKAIHTIMFGGLAGAAAFDWQRTHRQTNLSRGRMAAICAICVLAGALDEIAQGTLTVARSAEWADLGADALGIAVAFFAAPPAIRRVLHLKNG